VFSPAPSKKNVEHMANINLENTGLADGFYNNLNPNELPNINPVFKIEPVPYTDNTLATETPDLKKINEHFTNTNTIAQSLQSSNTGASGVSAQSGIAYNFDMA
jgi:hypothetical protein